MPEDSAVLTSPRQLRKRKRPESEPPQDASLLQLLQHAAAAKHMVVFSGSGLSMSTGMSMFSTNGGLYQRAQKQFKIPDGKKLFMYSFYEKQKLAVMAFFAEIHMEASRAVPGPGHVALAALAKAGKLQRQFTLNIDGLSMAAGMSTWHMNDNPTGLTVEMHGSIHQLVCPDCTQVVQISPAHLSQLRAKQAIACPCRPGASLRCRIMLYGDMEDDAITPESVFDVMEEDLAVADLVLWVGISFEQSASVDYFRRVRSMLRAAHRVEACTHVLLNPSEDALWNLTSACSNLGDLRVIQVQGLSDEVLPMVASAAASGTSSPMPNIAGSEVAEPDQAAEAGRTLPKCLEKGGQATKPSL